MILHSQLVAQSIDLDDRGHFVKELVLARGPMPIALVRKRATTRLPESFASEREPARYAAACRAPVLLIHGFGQNRYAFHLPARSMANQLARAGFDVYNVDLRGRGRSGHLGARRPRSVLDFVHEDVPAVLEEIQKLSGPAPVFLIGHSLGGVVSYCVAVDRPDRVAGIVSIGSPYHFTLGSRWLAWVAQTFLAFDQRLGIPDLVVPARQYGAFVRSARRLVESRLYPVPFRGYRPGAIEPEVLAQHMALAMDRGSIGTMRAMFRWAVEAKKDGDDALFGYAGRFEALDVPLLVIAGKYDDLAPPASVEPAYRLSHSSDKLYRELPFGHIDLLVGRDAPQLTWPVIESWLSKRVSDDRRAASSDARRRLPDS
jgi:pimeloyl-ACP methyl ester carboxylesterase